jgi:sugar phosphate isomerase/epimerase
MTSIRKLTLALALVALTVGNLSAETKIASKYKTGGFAIGCQAYTFKEFTAFEAIEKTAEAGGKLIEFFPGQKLSAETDAIKCDHNLSDENIAKLKAKLKKHGVLMVNYGVVTPKGGEAEWQKVFEYAKKLGLYGITTESVKELDVIEKLVKKFGIRVGIHEHAKREDDSSYKLWDPNYVLSLVKDRDLRIGACADTGHWQTSGLDPLEGIKILKGRIISVHLKDKTEPGHAGHDVPYGTGSGKIKEILDELKAQGFKGNISVEYEYNWLHSVPDVKQCIDFVRDAGKKK